jgi:hypothetical protein
MRFTGSVKYVYNAPTDRKIMYPNSAVAHDNKYKNYKNSIDLQMDLNLKTIGKITWHAFCSFFFKLPK